MLVVAGRRSSQTNAMAAARRLHTLQAHLTAHCAAAEAGVGGWETALPLSEPLDLAPLAAEPGKQQLPVRAMISETYQRESLERTVRSRTPTDAQLAPRLPAPLF